MGDTVIMKTRYNICSDGWKPCTRIDTIGFLLISKNIFFAGTISTQRRESINSFFWRVFGEWLKHILHNLCVNMIMHLVVADLKKIQKITNVYSQSHWSVSVILRRWKPDPYIQGKNFAIFEEEFKQAMTYKCSRVGCEGMITVYQVKKHVGGRSRRVNTR